MATAEATRWNVNLVTARAVPAPGNVQGVTDRFTFEGRIFGYATFVAESPFAASPPRKIEFKWFNGDRLVHQRAAEYTFSSSPFYLTHAVSGPVLGAGNCRVEVHSDGTLVAAKSFVVREQ